MIFIKRMVGAQVTKMRRGNTMSDNASKSVNQNAASNAPHNKLSRKRTKPFVLMMLYSFCSFDRALTSLSMS